MLRTRDRRRLRCIAHRCAAGGPPRLPTAGVSEMTSGTLELTPPPDAATMGRFALGTSSHPRLPEAFMPVARTFSFLISMVAAALLAATPAHAQVRVGSKNFTEQFVVAEIYAQALEAAGIKVERKINLGGTLIAQKALEEKQIDLYPEYTGTMLLVVLKADPMTDQKAVYDKVKAEYATKGFVVLNE